MNIILAAMITLSCGCVLAGAQNMTGDSKKYTVSETNADLVNKHTRGEARLVAEYPGPDGYIIACMRSVDDGKPAKPVIGWIPPAKDRLIIGLMLVGDAEDLSAKYFSLCQSVAGENNVDTAEQVNPEEANIRAGMVTKESFDLNLDYGKPLFDQVFPQLTVEESIGDKGSVDVVVYSSSYCPHCIDFWKEVGEGVEGLNIHHVPVATTKSGMKVLAEDGLGIVGTVKNARSFVLLVDQDGSAATPTLFWKDPKTGEDRVFRGAPGDKAAILEAIRTSEEVIYPGNVELTLDR